jgi:hypothetical protein
MHGWGLWNQPKWKFCIIIWDFWCN